MTLIGSIGEVWEALMDILMGFVTDVQPLFYSAETGLTFVGTLSIVAVGIAVILLIVNIVRSFLHLR